MNRILEHILPKLRLVVEIQILQGDLLPLSQDKEVHKGSQGLRVVAALYHQAKEEGWSKEEFLEEAAKIEGIYVPSLYEPVYREGLSPRRLPCRTWPAAPGCGTAPAGRHSPTGRTGSPGCSRDRLLSGL